GGTPPLCYPTGHRTLPDSPNPCSRWAIKLYNLVQRSESRQEGEPMANDGLPAEWEALSHSARVRKAVEVGRQSRSGATAAKLLGDWRTGGFTQRLLATFACHGSRDSAALLALTADPSRAIACVALAVLCDVGDDNSLLAALRDVPPRRAATALFWLRRPRP